MPSIFVSYRRSDAPGHAGRLYDGLVERFGEANVFKDLDSMEPGADFEKVIRDTIARCDVLIAIIGDNWLARNEEGQSRLHDPDDWVRLELANALSRTVRVVPVLVNGASLPEPSDLPEDVRTLTRRHAVVLNEDVWKLQVAQLVDSLQHVLEGGSPAGRDDDDVEDAPDEERTDLEEALAKMASDRHEMLKAVQQNFRQ